MRLLLVLVLRVVTSQGEVPPPSPLYWNSSNPLFKGDAVMEVNKGNTPWQYDQV